MVVGRWPARARVLDKPLHKYQLPDGDRRVRVTVPGDPDAMPALTLVRLRETLATAYSLLEVTIKTGRTHQIHVHLAHEGFPIVGDDSMGISSSIACCSAQMRPRRSGVCSCTPGDFNSITRPVASVSSCCQICPQS